MTDFSKVIGFGSASQHIKFVKEGHRRGSPHFCVHWCFFSFFGRHWYIWGLFCLQLALYSWPCQPLAAVIFAGIISCGFSAWSLWSSDFWWFSLKPWAGGYYWPRIFHLMGEQGPCHFALSATEVLGEVGLWSQRCCLAQFRDWAESQFGGNGEPTWTNPNPNSSPWLGFRLKLNPNP